MRVCGSRLVAAIPEEELNTLVAELKSPDESRRVPIPCREDGDLEELARLHGGLGDPLPGQILGGRRGQGPGRDFSLGRLVRDVEFDARVRIREVQLLEPALKDDFLIQV